MVQLSPISGEKAKTGFSRLDSFLAGGIEKGVLTAACGEAGSGKTTLGILLALASIGETGKPAVFIDTEGGLSAERIRQISPKADLKKILLKRAFDFRTQEKAVLSLGKQDVSSVIIDSVVHNYRLLLNDKTAREVNLRLSAQLSALNRLALEREIPVLVTGHTYRKIKDASIGLAGGMVMEYLPKTILLIERGKEDGRRILSVFKSRALPEGKRLEFSIGEKGFY